MWWRVPELPAGRTFRGVNDVSIRGVASLRGLAVCARVPLHSVAERGLMENLSLVIGLRSLLLIAALFYLVAGIGLRNASTSESTTFDSTGEREPDAVPDSV